MADQDFQLRVETDAEGGCCWEVRIDGILHQNRSQAPLRKLIEQQQGRQPHNPSAQWAQLEPIEGLDEDADAGQPGWAGMVRDGSGWREG
jgi:hypothetical protein